MFHFEISKLLLNKKGMTYASLYSSLQKDPFYELEMPIRCELFTLAVDSLIQRLESGVKVR